MSANTHSAYLHVIVCLILNNLKTGKIESVHDLMMNYSSHNTLFIFEGQFSIDTKKKLSNFAG